MERAPTRLKELRKAAVPRLTVRRIAELLDMPLGSYARYESLSGYKKRYLPLDFTRKVAAVLTDYHVDPVEVMALAGLTETIPGYAVVDNDPKVGSVIGKAIETKDDTERGSVHAVVGRV